jgi:broad specificity phosphatase PhoE
VVVHRSVGIYRAAGRRVHGVAPKITGVADVDPNQAEVVLADHGTSVEILLVRHGESVGNAQDRMQGHSDFPLSETGRTQARRLGAWLAERGLGWERLYASPLRRAAETARLVHEAAGGPSPEFEPALVELRAGALEGLTFEEIAEKFPSYSSRALGSLGDFEEYGGESYAGVQARAAALREKLEARHRAGAERVLLVGHGGFNYQLLKQLVCEPVPRVCIVKMGNCSVTHVRLRERRGTFMGELVFHVPVELMGEKAREDTPL